MNKSDCNHQIPAPANKIVCYKLLAKRFEHPAGTLVYQYFGHDYGTAKEDQIQTGVKHIAVTLESSNAESFFTVPWLDLQKIEVNAPGINPFPASSNGGLGVTVPESQPCPPLYVDKRSTAQRIQWNLRSRLGNLHRLRWHLEQQLRATGNRNRATTYNLALQAVDSDIADVKTAMTKLPSKWKIKALAYAMTVSQEQKAAQSNVIAEADRPDTGALS